MPNQQSAEELQNPIIRKSEKRKVYSSFKNNISGAILADMQLISKYRKEFRFLLHVFYIISKNAWIVPLKDKKGITFTCAFQNIFDESIRKPKKYG